MEINLNENIIPLNEKYELNGDETKPQIIEKINQFINDNNWLKVYAKGSYISSFNLYCQKNNLKELHCNFFINQTNDNPLTISVCEDSKGRRFILRMTATSISEINARLSKNTLVAIYNACVKRIGDYKNTLIRIKNIKSAIEENGALFFIQDCKNEIILHVIKNFNYNTLSMKIQYDYSRILIYKNTLRYIISDINSSNKGEFGNSLFTIKKFFEMKCSPFINFDSAINNICEEKKRYIEEQTEKLKNELNKKLKI